MGEEQSLVIETLPQRVLGGNQTIVHNALISRTPNTELPRSDVYSRGSVIRSGYLTQIAGCAWLVTGSRTGGPERDVVWPSLGRLGSNLSLRFNR